MPRLTSTALALIAAVWSSCLVSAAPPLPRPPDRGTPTGVRLLLIGLDGADWQIAGPLIEAGRLPNLARLRDTGAWGDLRSTQPMLSPLLWTSIATGKSPDQHGIIDFLVRDPRSGKKVPISSTFRRTKALWNIYSETGRTADFIAWWATWPAETISGHMISERLAYSLFGYKERPEDAIGLVSPPGFLDEALAARVGESSIGLEDLRRFADISAAELEASRRKVEQNQAQAYADPINHLVRILASTRTYHAIALKLLRGRQPDILSIYYQGIDEVGHRFGQYVPPKPGWVDAAAYGKYRDVVTRFYEYQDALLGELLKAAGPGVTVVVVSDHGFLNGADRPDFPPDIELRAGEWHRLYGILVASGPGIRPGRLPANSIYDVTPTLLYLSGIPVAADFAGRPILDAIAPEFREKHRLTTVPTWDDPAGRRAGGESVPGSSAQIDEEILARLRSLGYIATSEIATGPEAGADETPGTLTNLINMASLELQKGDYARAEEIARSILARSPDHVASHALLSEALEGLGRDEEAMSEARTALNLTTDPSETLIHRFVHLCRRLGTLDEAKAYFLRATQIRAGRSEPWLGLGLAQSLAGETPAARASFLRALEIDPRSMAPLNGLYSLYERSGRPREMLLVMEKAAKGIAGSASHRALLGLVYAEKGDHRRAEEELRGALEIDPENATAISDLGNLLMRTGRIEEARRFVEQAVAHRGDQAEVRMALGLIYGKMGRLGESARQFSEAVRLDPRSATGHAQLGMILMMQDQHARAMPHLERALLLDPGLYELRLHLAVMYHDTRQFAACEEQLRKAIQDRPKDPEPRKLLASLLSETGRKQEADKELEALRALGGGP